MAQVTGASPYAMPGEIVDNDVPSYAPPASGAYTSPDPQNNAENGTIDSPIGAWAPGLRSFPGGVPDPMRLGGPRRDRRPDPTRHPSEFWGPLDADDAQRHAAETQDADGWTEAKGGSGKPAARNPRETPPPEPRPTSRMAPRSYTFLRQMFGGPRRLSGEHFSMADHRRDYPILGTQPVRSWRNTFRIEPTPYDVDIVDKPSQAVPDNPDAVYISPEVPLAPSSPGWRLS